MIEIPASKPYAFEASVRDHGWIALAPCRWIAEQNVFQRVERLHNGRVVLLHITGVDSKENVRLLIEVQADGPITWEEQEEIRRKVRWMLKLDEDLSEFYQLASRRNSLWKEVGQGRGRLLRSPTLFEDAIKTICTTNTTWSQTVAMVARLVKCLGDPFPLNPELRAFPTPGQVAAAGEKLFQEEIRLGYRNAYVLQLAQEVVAGRRDLEALRENSLPARDLKKTLKEIKGVGEYAANTLLMLLGYYHELGIDSEMRNFVYRKYFDGQATTDQEIAAIYEGWGQWKYLAYWFDELD